MRRFRGEGRGRAMGRSGELDLFAADVASSIGSGVSPEVTAVAASMAAMIPGASPDSAVDVGALTETAKTVLEGALPPLWVRGEVSDFKRHRNGHWYFCLRDATSQVRCVVWSRDQRDQRAIPAAPDEGMEVLAYGRLTVYAARGDLHLTITRLDARGDGLWRKALEATRLRLERDGLLAPERKRALPFAPRRIAVVTSPDGAAVRDVIAVVRRRAPGVEVIVSPAKVQGDGAPEELCAAIQRVCRWGMAEVMIVGRGGGGREDLWAFNDERVARAIAESSIPVISAVGHEIDVTIADLVADHRAATPSAAAEAAVPVWDDLLAMLEARRNTLRAAMQRRLEDGQEALAGVARDVARAATRAVERRRDGLARVAGRLDALSPLATLARGYAVAQDGDGGRTLSTVADFVPGRTFKLTVRDGSVVATPVHP